jgi:hypothetical protein
VPATGLPEGATVVATDAAGRPTHIRLDHPVNPAQTTETMGGNNPYYIGNQSATGNPEADTTHVVSTTPIAPDVTWVTVGGQAPRPPSPLDYPTPGSAAAQVAALQQKISQDNHDQTTATITGVDAVRDSSGGLIGYSPTNGSEVYSDFGAAADQHDKRLAGDPDPYSGPIIN